MAQVDFNKLIMMLRGCSNTLEGCKNCEYNSSSKCKTLLMRDAANAVEFLQGAVNEYSKYDSLLYSHRFLHTNPEDSMRSAE